MTTPKEVSKAYKLAYDLLSTTDAIPDEFLDDQVVLEELDSLVWLCETCGWWVEVYETDEDGNCGDCQ